MSTKNVKNDVFVKSHLGSCWRMGNVGVCMVANKSIRGVVFMPSEADMLILFPTSSDVSS